MLSEKPMLLLLFFFYFGKDDFPISAIYSKHNTVKTVFSSRQGKRKDWLLVAGACLIQM